ncbi:MAG: hypothetical protein ACK5HT_02800 [Draconibacterium sp.]
MKRSRSFLGLLTSLILIASISFAQTKSNTETDFTVQRDIKFKNSSDVKEVIIEVKSDDSMLQLMISSIVESGELSVEIYDPTNKKQGNFSIGTQLNSTELNEKVRGQIQKKFTTPKEGTWKVKFIAKNASGNISIWAQNYANTKQTSKDR